MSARLAHKMAIENAHVTADAVEATEFPHLAQRYRVQGVPKTVINERTDFVGLLPEPRVLDYVLRAVKKTTTPVPTPEEEQERKAS